MGRNTEFTKRTRLTPKTKRLMGIKEEEGTRPFFIDGKKSINSAFINVFDKSMWTFLSKSDMAIKMSSGDSLATLLLDIPTLCYKLKKEGFDPFGELPYTFDLLIWVNGT